MLCLLFANLAFRSHATDTSVVDWDLSDWSVSEVLDAQTASQVLGDLIHDGRYNLMTSYHADSDTLLGLCYRASTPGQLVTAYVLHQEGTNGDLGCSAGQR